MAKERIVTGSSVNETEEQLNRALRPVSLDDYVGQPRLVEKLSIAIRATQQRGEPMEHVLLHGPPGLGKTTLAHIIANELGTQLTVTSGPALARPADLVGTLTRLQPRDVLFIDEIHRLSPVVEEYLYPAMEDGKIDVTVDSGMHAKTITLPLKPFTLIGATTRAGLITGPMRSRFGMTHALEFYATADLLHILERSASLLEMAADSRETLEAVAGRSRGTPRIANRLLRRVRDYSQVRAEGRVDASVVRDALKLEGIDDLGLDDLDRRYMTTIASVYEGGPVGLEAVAASMGEDAGTLEDVVEPFLLQLGFVARTRRGRQLTKAGASHVGYRLREEDDPGQLFEGGS